MGGKGNGFKFLVRSDEDGLTLITISRAEALNALNSALLAELYDMFFKNISAPTTRVVILTGEGKAFVAGADIAELRTLTPERAKEFSAYGQRLFRHIETMEIPVIAAINGFALGGGCELAMACDLRIASERAKLGQPEVNLGLIPGFAGTQRLARLVGPGRAKLLILSGQIIDADTALKIGLVDRVVPHEELLPTALELARTIAQKGPLAVRLAKRVINQGLDVGYERGAALENEAFPQTFASGEAYEGLSAFLEKRPPKWS